MKVRLDPWGPGDHALLRRLNGDPAMMEHLGGAETEEKIAERQARFERDPGCLKIVADGNDVGWVGYWEREWRGGTVYEMGWTVLPEAQGRGIAVAATRLAIEAARATGRHRHARVPVGRQRGLERDLQEARLHAAGGARLRVPAGQRHAL